jgi:hypothetical protein
VLSGAPGRWRINDGLTGKVTAKSVGEILDEELAESIRV